MLPLLRLTCLKKDNFGKPAIMERIKIIIKGKKKKKWYKLKSLKEM